MNSFSKIKVKTNHLKTDSQGKSVNMDSQIMILKDGRRLGYAEYGVPNGTPIFYFHGFPGSRLEGAMIKTRLARLNLQFIVIDRPGMGLSDFQKKRSILDCPSDILELAEYLGLKKFSVLGVSGGGPYALACAYKISSEKLTGCAIVASSGTYTLTTKGMSRKSKFLLFMARYFPWSIRILIWLTLSRNIKKKTWWENSFTDQSNSLPEPDKQVMNDLKIKKAIVKKTLEAFQQGTKGLVHDFNLYSMSWGFKLSEIPSETKVFLFHGELDANIPVSIARFMSERIPNCETKFYQNEAHISTFINHFDEIMRVFA